MAMAVFLLLFFPQISQAATLTGKVNFTGQAPAPQLIKTDADPACKLTHPQGVAAEEVVVNPNGTLKNVFVYVKEGLTDTNFPASPAAVTLDQNGCHYEPHVFGIQVNQPLEIVNSDDTLHNVHALPKNSKEFNIGMPIKGMKMKKSFTTPEVMVRFKCDVHPWMSAYAGVLPHPFFSVSNADGVFNIDNLKPGQYVIEAWHEKYGTQTQSVTIGESDTTKDISFDFKG